MILMALVAIAVLAFASIRRIPEGQVYTLRRVGGHTRVMHSGMHFMLPLIERVAHKISLTGANVPVDDLVAMDRHYRGVVYFQVLDPGACGADDSVEQAADFVAAQRDQCAVAGAGSPFTA